MGSGKGKARRGQAHIPQPRVRVIYGPPEATSVELESQIWAEFVQGTGVETVKLTQYYLGEDKDCGNLSDAEYEQLMADLFADHVATGAVMLPGPLGAEDI